MILWRNLIDLMAINLKSRKRLVWRVEETIIRLKFLNNQCIIHIRLKINFSHRCQCNLEIMVKFPCNQHTSLKHQMAMVTNITNKQIFKPKVFANHQNHKHISWIWSKSKSISNIVPQSLILIHSGMQLNS